MKKNFFNAVIMLIVLGSSILSCTKDEETEIVSTKSTNIVKEIEKNALIVGEEHNKGLAYIYSELEKMDITKLTQPEAIQAVRDIHENYCYSLIKDFDKYLVFLEPVDNYVAYLEDTSLNSELYLKNVIDELKYSPSSKNILYSLNDLLSNSSNSYEYVITEIEKLIEKSKADINDETELSVTMSALYTGKYSINYWYNNGEKWMALVGNNSKKPFSWSSAGKSDISGAIGGGLVGAAVGGTVSLGAATVPSWAAGAITGGLGNSAINAVDQLLDWLW